MYNSNQYNAQLFNVGPHSLVDVSSVLSYNGYSLKTDKVITSEINGIDDLPELNHAIYDIAKSHGM